MILFILLSESERSAHRLRHGAEEGPGGHPQDLIQVGQVYQKRITLSLIKFRFLFYVREPIANLS